jgi:hypothetical protein
MLSLISLTGCSNLSPSQITLTINDYERSCQYHSFTGVECIIEIENWSDTPWIGSLRANLISIEGKTFANSIDSREQYAGRFNEQMNPGSSAEWVVRFYVEPQQAYDKLEIIDEISGKAVNLDVSVVSY